MRRRAVARLLAVVLAVALPSCSSPEELGPTEQGPPTTVSGTAAGPAVPRGIHR